MINGSTDPSGPIWPIPLCGFCAASGTGKTTLLRYVIAELTQRGLRVGAIKQARDDFRIDQPGKDSERLRRVGIDHLLIGSERQSALIVENPRPQAAEADPRLEELLGEFNLGKLDLILVEGFANEPIPKIELRRTGAPASTPRYLTDEWVIAIAIDSPHSLATKLPVLDIDDPWRVCDFVIENILTKKTRGRNLCQ